MDMVKDDTCSFSVSPCIPEAEKNGSGTAPEVFSPRENCSLSKEDGNAHSDGLKSLESEEIKNCVTTLSHDNQVLDVLSLSKTGGNTLFHGDQKGSVSGKISDVAVELLKHILFQIRMKLIWYSCIVNGNDPKGEHKSFNGLPPFENGYTKNHLSCETPRTDHPNISGMEEGLYLNNKDQKCNDNGGGSNGADDCDEEQIMATSPDMGISNLEMNFAEYEENPKRKNGNENDK